MTLYLRLYWEFFKTGLFAIGGGMATLPFLKDIGATTGWFSQTDLMNMLAVSESTPGPVGINMATYVGYMVGGVPGAIVATIGEVTPSIIVILIVAAMLAKFRDSQYVANAFYGLRPASTGLIGAACVSVVLEVLTNIVVASPETGLFNQFQLGDGGLAGLISWPGLILAAVLLLRFTGLPAAVVSVLYICTAMPCAATTAMQSEMYHCDNSLASRGVALSTAFSILTLPLMLLLA